MGFGFSLSGSKKKETSTTTGSFDRNTTTTAPAWLDQTTQDLLGRNSTLASANPQNYIAGTNQNLQLAGANAASLSGTPWAYDAATDLTRGASDTTWANQFVNGAKPDIAGGISAFMNPYLKDVVDSTSADLDANDGRVRAQQDLDLRRNGAFGGSGAALTQSATEGELSRARGSTLGGLRNHGWETAANLSAQQQQLMMQDQSQKFGFGLGANNQRLQAADQLAGIADRYGANTRSNIGVQQTIGDAQRGVEQQQAQAPLDLASWQMENMPPWLQQYFGQNETGTETSTTKGKTTMFGGSVSGSAGGK